MTDNPDSHADLEVIDLASQVDGDGERAALVPPAERLRQGPAVARRRWRRILMVALVLAFALWCAAGVASLLAIRGDVTDARDDLLSGRDALVDGDVGAAATRFTGAADVLGSLPGRVSSPLIWPIRLVPVYRRTLAAVGSLGEAGRLGATAAASVTGELAEGTGGLGSLTPREGHIPVDVIARLSPVLSDAAQDMADAVTMARNVADFGVDQSVIDGRREFLELLEPTVAQMRLGAEVAEVLPALFGSDGPRRYLVVASNPTEARGTGGFLGAFTTMEADDGQMTFGPVRETQELPIPPAGTVAWPDPSLAERWDVYGGSSRMRSINMTPDFPAAARTIENYWSTVMGEELDGVISVDPFAFESLLSVSGPVELPGFGVVPADEVVEFVSHSAYAFIEDPAQRKRLIGDVATSSLQGFLAGPGDVTPGELLSALSEMARRDSLLIHSVREPEQALLVEAGLAGDLTAGEGDMLAVILNSGSGSKIDYFLDRSVRYDVDLQDDGSVDAILSAGFTNNAPTSGELTYMIGPPGPDVTFVAGDNVSYTSVYCVPGCTFFEVPDIGYADLPTTESVELGFPVASTWMLIPSMRNRELIYSYNAPGAWVEDGADQVYSLRYVHQTALRPTDVQIRVEIPEGMSAAALPTGAEVVDGSVVVSIEATTDADLQIRFSPAS